MIAPVIIAVGPKYREMAIICFKTYAMHHTRPLIALVERAAIGEFENQIGEPVRFYPVGPHEIYAKKVTGISRYAKVQYGQVKHFREYSSLKPIIAEDAISAYMPSSRYGMTMDVDGLFSGDVVSLFEDEIRARDHIPELYLVQRSDARMHRVLSRHSGIGSGVTLWKRAGRFISLFQKYFNQRYADAAGGSQTIINKLVLGNDLRGELLQNPYLHFVSPDKVKELTDEQIRQFCPAYIHLHGNDCAERMRRFARAFGYQVGEQ